MSDEQPAQPGPKTDALAAPQPSAIETWKDPDWQSFWLTLETRPWRSLALIPAGPGGPRNLTLTVAVSLSRIGVSQTGGPVHVADANDVPLHHLNGFFAVLRGCVEAGERVIVALSAVKGNPTASAIAKFCDNVLLCIVPDCMHSAQANETIKLIGRSSFLGSVILRQDGTPNGK